MEEYKKKYEMALERAREELGSGCFNRGSIEYIFPELKKESESDDEQIRKELISFVRNDGWKFIKLTKEEKKSWIAWLEKQKSVAETVKKCKDSWYNEGKIAGQAEGLTDDERYWQGYHDALEKQSKSIDKEKVLIGARKDVALSIMNFLDRNTLGMCLSSMECADLESAVIDSDWSKVYDYMKKKLETQGEQKPVDKVEPKFKVGDWIANNINNTAYHIDNIYDGRYYITRSNGDKTYNSIRIVDDHAHLWSINDAKPGDVLANSKSIFIFKGIYMADKPEAYCAVMKDSFNSFVECSEGCWTNEQCYPATREQQRLLFEKITEAGYKWEKEVLNKIEMRDLVTSETNVTKISDQDKWNNEDIRMLNTVINIFEKVYPSNYFTTFTTGSENPMLINSPEIVKWLKSIKQKALGKLKLTKEDLEALRIAIINLGDMAEVDAINNFNMTFGEAKEKLIEIKDRYAE